MIMITTIKTTFSTDETIAQTIRTLLQLLEGVMYSVVLCTSPVKQHLSSCIQVTLHAAITLAAYRCSRKSVLYFTVHLLSKLDLTANYLLVTLTIY